MLLHQVIAASLPSTGVGTSSSPCRDTYHGPRPFSEIEVVNVARYLYRNRRNLVGYMDIHAYSQLWMTPWGFTKANPRDYSEMVRALGEPRMLRIGNGESGRGEGRGEERGERGGVGDGNGE